MPALLLLLAVLLTGCGGDSPGSTSPETLTLSTADQQAGGVLSSTPAAIALGGLTPDLTAAAVASQVVRDVALTVGTAAANAATIPIERSTACPAGGTAQSTGTLTGTLTGGGSGSLAAALTQTLTACAVTVDGRTLLIASAPTLSTTATYTVVARVPTDQQVMRVTGNTTVGVSGGRAAAVPCAVDVTLTTTRSTRSASLTGSFCGAAVNQTYTWTP